MSPLSARGSELGHGASREPPSASIRRKATQKQQLFFHNRSNRVSRAAKAAPNNAGVERISERKGGAHGNRTWAHVKSLNTKKWMRKKDNFSFICQTHRLNASLARKTIISQPIKRATKPIDKLRVNIGVYP